MLFDISVCLPPCGCVSMCQCVCVRFEIMLRQGMSKHNFTEGQGQSNFQSNISSVCVLKITTINDRKIKAFCDTTTTRLYVKMEI